MLHCCAALSSCTLWGCGSIRPDGTTLTPAELSSGMVRLRSARALLIRSGGILFKALWLSCSGQPGQLDVDRSKRSVRFDLTRRGSSDEPTCHTGPYEGVLPSRLGPHRMRSMPDPFREDPSLAGALEGLQRAHSEELMSKGGCHRLPGGHRNPVRWPCPPPRRPPCLPA